MRKCSIKECDEDNYIDGYCSIHYQIILMGGFLCLEDQVPPKEKCLPLLENISKNKICSTDGCPNTKNIRNRLCPKHLYWLNKRLSNLKKYGDPLWVKPPRKCSIEECEEKHRGKGYCQKHLYKFEKYGDPLWEKILKIKQKEKIPLKQNKDMGSEVIEELYISKKNIIEKKCKLEWCNEKVFIFGCCKEHYKEEGIRRRSASMEKRLLKQFVNMN